MNALRAGMTGLSGRLVNVLAGMNRSVAISSSPPSSPAHISHFFTALSSLSPAPSVERNCDSVGPCSGNFPGVIGNSHRATAGESLGLDLEAPV